MARIHPQLEVELQLCEPEKRSHRLRSIPAYFALFPFTSRFDIQTVNATRPAAGAATQSPPCDRHCGRR
jgi:hypothetical protein